MAQQRPDNPVSAVSVNSPPRPIPALSSPQPRGRRPPTANASSPPFIFPPLFQSISSSTSLVPSTAEGRPIPLDDSTAAHRTTALRELSRSQPSSRHRYTKNSGAPSITSTTTGTYSQPVLVRTYSGPHPSSSARTRPASRRVPLSTVSVSSNSSHSSNWRPGRNGMAISMTRQKGKTKSMPRDDARLPPLEAFSFKSIMADMQQDIGADLDRIAEICARSRYSLSNQYEVHMAPHGSGAGFLGSPPPSSRHQAAGGPTLEAIPSDDEHTSTRHRSRRGATRRRSTAYGTLETIMSSSRSSEEDKSKKKSAAEIADEVRGRAARNSQDESGSADSTETQASSEQHVDQSKVAPPKSTSSATAVMDSSLGREQGGSSLPRGSGTALVSRPAQPETSRNHLQTRTLLEDPAAGYYTHEPPPQPSPAVVSDTVAAAAIANPEKPVSHSSRLLSGFSSWVPWRGPVVMEVAASNKKGGRGKSYAEGSLRELLKSAEPADDQKGGTVDRAT